MAEDKSIELILFEQAKAKIETVDEIMEVVAWNSQTTNEERERPYQYPFVGIQITTEWLRDSVTNNYDNVNQNEKKGISTVSIYIVTAELEDETTMFLNWKPVAHKVHRALNVMSYLEDDGSFTSLMLQSTAMDDLHDGVMTLPYVYTTEVIETGVTAAGISARVTGLTPTRG